MPYAHENQISQQPIEGGIEITQGQYDEALVSMQAGKVVTIQNGFALIDPPDPNDQETPQGPEPEPLTPEQLIQQKIKEGDAKITERLDAQARLLGFDNIVSGVSNASLPIGEYKQAEGAALLLWRARTWQKAEEIRDAFLAGERSEPTWQEIESELPTYPITQE